MFSLFLPYGNLTTCFFAISEKSKNQRKRKKKKKEKKVNSCMNLPDFDRGCANALPGRTAEKVTYLFVTRFRWTCCEELFKLFARFAALVWFSEVECSEGNWNQICYRHFSVRSTKRAVCESQKHFVGLLLSWKCIASSSEIPKFRLSCFRCGTFLFWSRFVPIVIHLKSSDFAKGLALSYISASAI